MTQSMIAARLITDLICGVSNPFHSLYTPRRFPVHASTKQLFPHMRHSAKGLIRHILPAPLKSIDQLPPGQGRIVNYNGQKTGIYKDLSGQLHMVSPYCPHMGCELTWNPDEQTWDCPCHGSRFDYDGRLLDPPAKMDLPVRPDR